MLREKHLGRILPCLMVAAGLLAVLLAGCSAPAPAPVPTSTPETPTMTATSVPPTETPTPTVTSTETSPPPTATFTPTRTETPLPTSTATLTPTVTLAPVSAAGTPRASSPSAGFPGGGIKIYFVQLDTGGGVGCGDSVVGVGSGAEVSGDTAEDVEAGLRSLFASKWDYSGALYNPLYRSNLSVQHVEFDDPGGLISIWLSGDYNPSGDDCDNTRVKAQIWSTVRQFRGIERTNIFLNDIPFGDRLSNDK